MQQYNVSLEIFTGPMDLLLHLIDIQELDIYDIPISIITEQYLEFIKNKKVLDLDNLSDFLLMAATLVSLKAKMLLPMSSKTGVADEAIEDPREELVQHLLVYKKIKEAAEILRCIEKQQSLLIARPVEQEQIVAQLFPNIPVKGLGHQELLAALDSLLKQARKGDSIIGVAEKSFYVEKQMELIIDQAIKKKKLLFYDLITDPCNILELIVTFLALLELVRMQKIQLVQKKSFESIILLYRC